jgi:methylated-DNA-[protein]-cysteine S-methyltransferase
MKNLQSQDSKLRTTKLDQALDTLFSEHPAEAGKRAQARLTKALADVKEEVVFYGKLHHPTITTLYLAMRKKKVIAIKFGITEKKFLQQIEKQFKTPAYFAPDKTDMALAQVKKYLNGQHTNFGFLIDISPLSDFQQQVLQATQQIPRGRIATYMEIARQIGKPKAVRAVGQALGRNPIPIVIPCHRVIASNGSLGGYSGGGGLETKAKLLQLEGAQLHGC